MSYFCISMPLSVNLSSTIGVTFDRNHSHWNFGFPIHIPPMEDLLTKLVVISFDAVLAKDM